MKTGQFVAIDLAGLLEFSRRFRSYRPLVVCDERSVDTARRVGVEAISWRQFLWSGVQEV